MNNNTLELIDRQGRPGLRDMASAEWRGGGGSGSTKILLTLRAVKGFYFNKMFNFIILHARLQIITVIDFFYQ